MSLHRGINKTLSQQYTDQGHSYLTVGFISITTVSCSRTLFTRWELQRFFYLSATDHLCVYFHYHFSYRLSKTVLLQSSINNSSLLRTSTVFNICLCNNVLSLMCNYLIKTICHDSLYGQTRADTRSEFWEDLIHFIIQLGQSNLQINISFIHVCIECRIYSFCYWCDNLCFNTSDILRNFNFSSLVFVLNK